MTKQETQTFLERIKNHYQDFIIDEGKIKEWHSYLKDYDNEDISKKLDEHLRNEKYSGFIPKVEFLTKYIIKSEDKGKKQILFTYCNLCGTKIQMEDFDYHYNRCLSASYIVKRMKQYFNKDIDIQDLITMKKIDFDNNYKMLLEKIYKITKNDKEKQYIYNSLYRKEEEN